MTDGLSKQCTDRRSNKRADRYAIHCANLSANPSADPYTNANADPYADRFARIDALATMHQRILLLQGPNGPFFAALGKRLSALGAATWKVNFNGGDTVFYRGPDVLRFDGQIEHWASWLTDCLAQRSIDAVLLFGQSRAVHRQAIALCEARGIAVYVFEEGYARPWWITMERGGVNERSALNRCDPTRLPLRDAPKKVMRWRGAFFRMVLWSVLYVLFSALLRRRFPAYVHHWPLRVRTCWKWLRASLRALFLRWAERDVRVRLMASNGRSWFLVPLQTQGDSQLRVASRWETNDHFIVAVIESFARHAAATDDLVFKHHPLERGLTDYRACVASHAARLDVVGRVHYVHFGNLPKMLARTKGVVLVNSTVGIQALFHGTPVCVTGDACYAHEHLISGTCMDTFWARPMPPNTRHMRAFFAHMLHTTQINTSFYACADVAPQRRMRSRLASRIALCCMCIVAVCFGTRDAIGALLA